MKIKVTFEREFDSNEFYGEEVNDNLNFYKFKDDVSNLLWEWSDEEVITHLEFEEIKE